MHSVWAHLEIWLHTRDPLTAVLMILLHLMELGAAVGVLFIGVRLVAVASAGTDRSDQRKWTGALMTLSTVAAFLTAWTVCGGPFLLPGMRGVQQAAGYLGWTFAVASAVILTGWLALENRPPLHPLTMIRNSAIAWLALPCMMMLAMGHSAYALLMAFGIAYAAVRGIKRSMAQLPELPPQRHYAFESLWGIRYDPPRWCGSVFAAICVPVVIALTASAHIVPACAVLITATASVLWRRSASRRSRKRPRTQWLVASAVAVVSLLVMVGLQSIAPKLGFFGDEAPVASKPEQELKYFSVILLPPPVKQHTIAPPRAQGFGTHGKTSGPIEIPFTGVYWYFQPPLVRPDDNAHTAHGRASEVHVSSVGESMLLMQAHLPLARSIDISCCHEIIANLTNNDARAEAINIALVLRDNTSTKPLTLTLSPQPLPTSEQGSVASSGGPVQDKLYFVLDEKQRSIRTLQHFDEIDLLYLPSWSRRFTGTRVEVRSFTLMP